VVIGGEDAEDGFRIALEENLRGQRQARGRVALRRFGEDLLARHFGQLPADLLLKMGVGEHPNAFGRNDGPQAFERFLDERLLTEKREQLFWRPGAAFGPEAGAAASGKDEAIVVRVRHF
jgi:hypothetical protein